MFAMLVTLAGGSRHPGDASLANFILQMADEVFTTLENIPAPFLASLEFLPRVLATID